MSRPQSASALPSANTKDGLKKVKKRGTVVKPITRKSITSRKQSLIPGTPLIKSATVNTSEITKDIKTKDDTIVVPLPSAAWTSKSSSNNLIRPKTAPSSKSSSRSSNKKGINNNNNNNNKKGHLVALPKKLETLSPSMLLETIKMKNKEDLLAIEQEDDNNKFVAYRELLDEQERRARSAYIQVTVIQYSDNSIVLEKLYPPTATVLDVKADVQKQIGGKLLDTPPEYDRDESFYRDLVAVDHQVLRVGDCRLGIASRSTSIIAARDEDTLKNCWYMSPVGHRAKAVELMKHAQKRVEHMNMAARKKNVQHDNIKKERRNTTTTNQLAYIDTKKSSNKNLNGRNDDLEPLSAMSSSSNNNNNNLNSSSSPPDQNQNQIKGWVDHRIIDDYSIEGVEARRNKLLFFSESWVLDDDHDHLLKFIEMASGKSQSHEDDDNKKSNIKNKNKNNKSNSHQNSTSTSISISPSEGGTLSEFDLDFILGRSSITSQSLRNPSVRNGEMLENKHKDITSWRQSDWNRKLAQEWHPEEDDEEDISQLSAIKQADRMNAKLRAQRHSQSLEKRRLNMLNKDVNKWDGVLILDGRASKIHLAHLNPPLKGRIDQGLLELGRLTGLLRINLSDNQLKGKIPGAALARLLNLTSINLSRNQFTGRIPCEDLSHVSSLTDLRLSANRLTGPLLPSLCKCSKLKTLELSSNSLSGELPEQIGTLNHLLVLNLSRNQFTGWLKKWIGMNTLQRLSLQHNYLRGGLPESLGRLWRCEYLHLNDNRFDGDVDVSIFSTIYYGIREIHLQGNRFFDDDSEARFQAADNGDDDSYFEDNDSDDDDDSANSHRRAKLLETKFELQEMFSDCSVLI